MSGKGEKGKGVNWGGWGQTPRAALHTINSCLQNSFDESHNDSLVGRADLNALHALPVHLVFEDAKLSVRKKQSREKPK